MQLFKLFADALELKINVRKIDYLLILTWNLKKEIILQEKKYMKSGGKFIVPFPKPKVISNIY